jgi:hypothetical protein
MLGEHQDST